MSINVCEMCTQTHKHIMSIMCTSVQLLAVLMDKFTYCKKKVVLKM